MAVFDASGDNVNKEFSCTAGNGTQSGTFSGTIDSWDIGQHKTFNAAYPYDGDIATQEYGIYVLYIPEFQTQDFTSDASKYAHLEAKDFMAASPVIVTKPGAEQPAINFNFKHLMAILDIEVTNNTGGAVTVESIQIRRSDSDFTFEAGINLSKTPEDVDFYSWTNNTRVLNLGLTNTGLTAAGDKITCSMIIAPVNAAAETTFYVSASGVMHQNIKSTGVMLAGKRYTVQLTL